MYVQAEAAGRDALSWGSSAPVLSQFGSGTPVSLQPWFFGWGEARAEMTCKKRVFFVKTFGGSCHELKDHPLFPLDHCPHAVLADGDSCSPRDTWGQLHQTPLPWEELSSQNP